jgi:hypothetical protein
MFKESKFIKRSLNLEHESHQTNIQMRLLQVRSYLLVFVLIKQRFVKNIKHLIEFAQLFNKENLIVMNLF